MPRLKSLGFKSKVGWGAYHVRGVGGAVLRVGVRRGVGLLGVAVGLLREVGEGRLLTARVERLAEGSLLFDDDTSLECKRDRRGWRGLARNLARASYPTRALAFRL